METFGGRRHATGHYHVERSGLMAHMSEALMCANILFLMAPYGYGKTTLLQDFGRFWRFEHSFESRVVTLDFAHGNSVQFVSAFKESRLSGLGLSASAQTARATIDAGLTACDEDDSGTLVEKGRSDGTRACSSACHVQIDRLARPDDPLSQLVCACIEMGASDWLERELCGESAHQAGSCDLLVLLDNVPEIHDERGAELFAKALRYWAGRGVQIVASCLPSNSLHPTWFADMPCLGSRDLLVGRAEYELWERDLCLDSEQDIHGVTRGIPLLLGAARLARRGRSLEHDETFLVRAGRIVGSGLREAVPHSVDRLRWAMVLLGSGELGDVEQVGVDVRADDVAELSERYPHFAIDDVAGTFRCVPIKVTGSEALLQQVVAEDARLAARCVMRLMDWGRFERASALARMLPAHAVVPLLARDPLIFADLALDDVAIRGLRFAAQCAAMGERDRLGLVRLDALRAYQRCTKRIIVQGKEAAGDGRFDGLGDDLHILDMLDAVWSGACAAAGSSRADAGGLARWVAPEDGETLDPGALLELTARAATQGDASALERLRPSLVRCAEGHDVSMKRVLLHHVALCDLLVGAFGSVIGLLAPETGRPEVATPSDGMAPRSISEALLVMDLALARLLSERPSACEPATLADITAARTFMEGRSVNLLQPLARLFEALGLVAIGRGAEARGTLEWCLASAGARGNSLVQTLCALCLATVCLSQGHVGQSQAFAAMADQLTRGGGARRLRAWADLMRTLAGLQGSRPSELDKRLLEVTLLQSALHPRTCLPLELERVILCAARGDDHEARELLAGIARMPRPVDIRLACVALRCAGPLYERLVTLMPADLRRELLAIDPQATLHGMSLTSSARMRNVMGEDREAELRIRLFGGLQVERGGQRIGDEDWGRQKARRLLACLALYPERALSREHVARALWPDANYEAARSGLYAALTTLRGALGQKHGGPAFVLAVGDALRLNLELVEVDVRTFEHLARSVLARRDVLPAGDQLEVCARIEEIYGTGVNLSVDDLGIEGRMRAEELGQLYVDCMVHASHVAGESGNPQLALWFARAAKRASPYREDVCLVLMHALGTLSRRSAAADAYHEVVEHLDEEAGVGPSDELRQAYAQLVEGEDGQMPAPLPTTEGEFVDELVS